MTKTKRNVISLPDEFCNALDNKIDNKMICNRTDAMKHIMLEFHKTNPTALKFEKKPETFSLPKWLTPHILDNIKTILNISDDANEQNALMAMMGVETAIKGWKAIGGNDGFAELHRYRAEQKAKQPQGAQP